MNYQGSSVPTIREKGAADHLMMGSKKYFKNPNLSLHTQKKFGKSIRSIFRLSQDEMNLMFNLRNMKAPLNEGETRKSLDILRDCGYIDGLCQLLSTHLVTGITGDTADVERRQGVYGINYFAKPVSATFEELLSAQFEDPSWIFLVVAATAYLILCYFDNSNTGHVEALTIYIGVLFACLISAFSDWTKERQFLKIADEVDKESVVVYRGAFGTGSTISVQELVVGDVIQINQGDRVPADCILFEEMNIKVD